ncbi:MAG: GNAT family N-acetyltransferase, partial [Planctomycetaceae bacterium]|nr:GNAT family N-acetyltransferase [Planctomycetaceae bacterium]
TVKVVVLCNQVSPAATVEELDVLAQRDAVAAALTQLGHQVELLTCSLNLEDLRQQLLAVQPELVFNLVESVGGTDRLMILIPLLLESLGIPFTGGSSAAMGATGSKLTTKHLLHQSGLPTAPWLTATSSAADVVNAKGIGDRWIVKPVWEHASVGMDDSCVVTTSDPSVVQQSIRTREAATGRQYFAEQFVDGREFNLSILAGKVLPVAEIDFSAYPQGKPRIVGHSAKWDEGSFEYQQTPRCFPTETDDAELLRQLQTLAGKCWCVFGLTGFARVDFRVDATGQPWILEINVNPCLSPDAGFAAAVAQAGFSYREAIRRIVEDQSGGYTETSYRLDPVRNDTRPATIPSSVDESCDRHTGDLIQLRQVARPEDRNAVREIVTATGFFRPDEIDVAVELVDERLNRGDASGYWFLFAELQDQVVGYACYGPIACTLGSYDLYWIAVDPDQQGRNIGRQLLKAAEDAIRADGGRHIYIETSGKPQYTPTRRFYERCGYQLVSTLPEFYDSDDDKVIWRKVLAPVECLSSVSGSGDS